jgi:hypothetical protein
MSESTQLTAISGDDSGRTAILHSPGIAVRKKEESLPFTISLVHEEARLDKAVSIRHAAYGRHVPTLAATLTRPEPNDYDAGTVLLLAESKLDGSALGTMRIQTNRNKPLALEASAELPAKFHNKRLAEATRLGVASGSVGRVVKTALFKAFYLCCAEAGVDWMVIAGRPPLDKQYEALLFEDVFPGHFVDLKHAANIPHRVLSLKVSEVEPSWHAARHPLYDYFFRTHHSDIDTSGVETFVQGEPVDQIETLRIMGVKS